MANAEWMLTEEDGHEFRRDNDDIDLAIPAEDAFDYGFGEGAKAQAKKIAEWLESKIVEPLPDSINGRLTIDLSPADILALKEVLGE